MPTYLPAVAHDPSDLAVAGFLARYREPTVSAYRRDLRCFWQWCADRDLAPLAAKRPHFELYLRDLERRGYAPATISRRLSTVAGLFKYAVIDELVAANPAAAVTRPRVPWEGQRRTVPHPLEFAAVLSAARRHSDTAHALVALLGMLGLRVSEKQQPAGEGGTAAEPDKITGRPVGATSSSQARNQAIVSASDSATGRPMPRFASHA